MKKLFVCVQVFLTLHSGLCAPQNEKSDDLDFSPSEKPSDRCLCVPFYLCQDGKIVENGSNLLDQRANVRDEKLGLDEAYGHTKECNPYHVCCRLPESSTVQPYEHKCGIRNPAGINGGILSPHAPGEAQFGEWPWQASILIKGSSEYIFQCGGALIDERHVLTAAHCAEKLEGQMAKVVVRLGEWDSQNTDEFLPHEDFGVSQIIIHPDYTYNNLYNDIAILRLSKDVTFKPHIDTVCLPRDEDDFTGQDCIVTGWGENVNKTGTFSMIMKEVSVPVLGHDECQNIYRKTRLGRYFKLHDSFLCAGGREAGDSCNGDGGGPLVCFRLDNSYTVAGLISWGYLNCRQPGVPRVYVNVKNFIEWITSKTEKPIEDYWRSR